jgi:hypothetical protein
MCIVNFSYSFGRAELEFQRRALFVFVVGTRPEVLANEVVVEVSHGFELEGSSLRIHHTVPEDFILFLPDEESSALPWTMFQSSIQEIVTFR